MKRFLSTVSILLTVVMLVAFAAPLSVLAADTTPVYGTAADFALNNSDKVNVIYAPELSGNSADNLAKVDGILDANDPWYNYTFTIPGTEVLTIWPSSGDTLTVANALVGGTSTDYHYTQDDKYIYIAIATHLNAQTIGGVKYVPHIFQENLYLGLNKGFDTFSTSDKVSGMYDAFRYEGGTGIETLEPNFDLGGYGTVKKIVASRYTADGKTLIKPYDENYVVGKQYKNGAREYMKDSYILYREIVIEKNQNKLPSTLSIRLDVNPFDYLPNSDREQTPVDLGYNFNLTGTNVTNDAELLAAAATAGVAPTVANNYKYFNDLIILDDKNTEATELGHITTDAFIAEETDTTATFYHSKSVAEGKWTVIAPGTFETTKNGDGTYTQDTTVNYNDNYYWAGCYCNKVPNVYGKSAAFALNNSDKVNVIYALELSGNSADNLAKVDGILDANDPWYNYIFTIPGTEVLTIWPSSGDTLTVANALVGGTSTDYHYTQDDKYIYIAIATHLNAQTIGGVKYVPHILQENLYLGLNTGLEALPASTNLVCKLFDTFRYEGGTGIETLEPNFDLGGYGTVKKIVTSRYTADGKTLIAPYSDYIVGKWHSNDAREYVKDSYILYREIVIEKDQENLPSTLSIRLDVNTLDYLPDSDTTKTPVGLGYNFNLTGTNVTNDAKLLAAATAAGVAPTTASTFKWFNDLIILDDKNTTTKLGHTMTDAFLAKETDDVATFYHSKSVADGQWNIIAPLTYEATNNGDGTYTQVTSTQKDATGHWQGCSCGAIVGDKSSHDEGSNADDCTKAVVCSCGYVTKAAKSAHEPEGEQVDISIPVKCKNCNTIVIDACKYGTSVDFALDNSDKVNVIYAPTLSGDSDDNLAKIDGVLDPNDPWYNYSFKLSAAEMSTIYPQVDFVDSLFDGISTDYSYTQDDKYIYIAIATHVNAQTIGGVKYVPHIYIENLYFGLNTGLDALSASNNLVCTIKDTFRYQGGTGIETVEPNFNLNGYGTVKKVVTSRYTADGKTLIEPYSDYIVGKWYTAKQQAVEYMTDSYILYREVVIEKNQQNLPSSLSIRLDVGQLDYLTDFDANKDIVILSYNTNLTGTNVTNNTELLAAATAAGVAPTAATTFKWFNDVVILDDGMTEENVGHTLDNKFFASNGSTEGTTNLYHSITVKNLDGRDDWKIIYPNTFIANNSAEGYTFSDASYYIDVEYDVSLTDSDADRVYTCEYDGLYFKSCACGKIGEGTQQTFTVAALVHDEATLRYNSDANEHWLECDVCNGVGVEKTGHVFDQKNQDEKYLVKDSVATCLKGADYYLSCICGFASDQTFEGSKDDISLHTFSDELFSDKSYHWNECTRCGATINVEKHMYDDKSDLECNVCEYIRKAPATDAPVIDAPTTDAPTTDAPITDAPTTDVPATDAPATEAPTTDAPVTDAPTTDVPATDAPATEAPTTESPVTEEPVNDSCNGTISLADLALVTMLGTCTVFATKKKED